MKKAIIIILTALLVLSIFISCDDNSIVDDEFTHMVTFDANGGKGTMKQQKVISKTPTALSENKFTYDDYHFIGWNTKADGSGDSYGDGEEITITVDMILYAMWSHDKGIITFDKNGGAGEMKSQIALTKTPITLNANEFTRTDYSFSGWNTKKDGTGTSYADKASVTLTGDLTLYAQWKHDTAKVIFNANGGEGEMADQVVDTNTPTALNANAFELEDNKFSGWNTKEDGSGTSYGNKAKISISENTTLYAQWIEAAVTITFKANGGTGEMEPQVVEIETETELDENTFEKPGYEFDHWNTMKDDTGTSFAADAKVTIENDLVLYAIWERLPIIFIDENTEVLIGGESYMIRKDVTIEKRLTIDGTGDVTILLPEKLTLDLENGISVAKKQSLIIEGEGTLKAKGNDNNAAIGSNSETDAGTITINGGNIIADGSIYAAGIGGGAGGNGAKVYLNGGTITATGGQYAPAIGGGDKSESDGILAVGEGMGLYGGTSDQDAEFISIPTEGYEGDLCMYMYAEATEYVTVSFDANEGEGTMDDQTVPAGIEWNLDANEFTHETLFFAGWALTAEGEAEYADKASVNLTEDTTLYAKWIDAISLDDTYGGSEGKKLTGGLRYTIADDLPLSGRLAIDGTSEVTLILPKDMTLTLEKGLNVAEGQALVIEGEGTLVATGYEHAAGIGGVYLLAGGTITIKGGTINATGGDYAAGIGGGYYGAGGTVTINGGTVTATGGDGAVGIGKGNGGSSNGTLELDGVAMLVSDDNATWVVYDGSTRTRYMKVPTPIVLTSSTTAWTSGNVYTLGDEDVEIESRITVSGSVGLILPDGRKLTASKGITVTGSNSLTINGGTGQNAGILEATGGDRAAGIGGGYQEAGGEVTINGGKVTANGGEYAAGIGGGFYGTTSGTVTINGGTVEAIGGSNGGAGLGGGYYGVGGTVTINGGTVTATGVSGGAGIGGGYYKAGGTVTISGGSVTANGGQDAHGIGRGYDGSSDGTLTLTGVTMQVKDSEEASWESYVEDVRHRYMKADEGI